MRCLLSVVVFLFVGSIGAYNQPTPKSDLQWNRFETQNFEILAINKSDGEYMDKSLEFMRRWMYDRWGFKQVDFSVKCKVIITPDRVTHRRLFKKDGSLVRIDREANGTIKALTIWAWADQRWHTSVLPYFLTEVCLAEFKQHHRVRLPLWLHRGMAIMNQDMPTIRRDVGSLSQIYSENLPCFWTEDITTMTSDKLLTYRSHNQVWFNRECAAFCLHLIKVHGRKKFLDFLNAKSPEAGLVVIGMSDYRDFDRAFNRFMYNLSSDIVAGRIKNAYLTWDSRP